jgi:hypothetical protein
VLCLDVQEKRDRSPLPEVEPLAGALDQLLLSVEATLRSRPDERQPVGELPDVRERYMAFERAVPRDGEVDWLLAELDEVVDAANSLAAVVGLDTSDTADDQVAIASRPG